MSSPLPSGDFEFLPGLLGPDEAHEAFHALREGLPWRQDEITLFGRRVAQPRLVSFCADPGVTYAYSGHTLPSASWIPALDRLRSCVQAVAGHAFNSVLCNLYRDGADSMGWHADDEASLGAEPVIASLTLGGTRRFLVRHRASKETAELMLATGSLLVMKGRSQEDWVHSIPKTRRPCEPRINLTFRLVGPKRGGGLQDGAGGG